MPHVCGLITRFGFRRTGSGGVPESVRSKGDDDEEVDGNSAFCQAAPAFALCRHSLHHRVNERFRVPGIVMPKRSTLRLTTRSVTALPVTGKDAVYWDRDLAGFGVRVQHNGRKVYVVQSRGPAGLRRVTLGPCAGVAIDVRRREAATIIDRIAACSRPAWRAR